MQITVDWGILFSIPSGTNGGRFLHYGEGCVPPLLWELEDMSATDETARSCSNYQNVHFYSLQCTGLARQNKQGSEWLLNW